MKAHSHSGIAVCLCSVCRSADAFQNYSLSPSAMFGRTINPSPISSLTERLSRAEKRVGRSPSIPMDARRLLKLSRGTAHTSGACIPITRYSRPGKAMNRSNAKRSTKCLKPRLSRRILTGNSRPTHCGKPSRNGSISSVLTSISSRSCSGTKTLLPRKPISGSTMSRRKML